MSDPRQFQIRRFDPETDRERVRELCCATGFLGNAIDPVFEDRQLFADYLTAYYTDWEPESSFVLLVNGRIDGYLLGSRRPLRQQFYNFFNNLSLFLRGIVRYPSYSAASKNFVRWIVTQAWKEVPAAPRRTAHFHINLLPEARQIARSRELMNAYLKHLRAHGEKKVFGQMVTFQGRRGPKMFERFGFRVINKAEITKYREVHPEPVYLCTVERDLEKDGEMLVKA